MAWQQWTLVGLALGRTLVTITQVDKPIKSITGGDAAALTLLSAITVLLVVTI